MVYPGLFQGRIYYETAWIKFDKKYRCAIIIGCNANTACMGSFLSMCPTQGRLIPADRPPGNGDHDCTGSHMFRNIK